MVHQDIFLFLMGTQKDYISWPPLKPHYCMLASEIWAEVINTTSRPDPLNSLEILHALFPNLLEDPVELLGLRASPPISNLYQIVM